MVCKWLKNKLCTFRPLSFFFGGIIPKASPAFQGGAYHPEKAGLSECSRDKNQQQGITSSKEDSGLIYQNSSGFPWIKFSLTVES